ncbi:MAG: PTS system mannose/fructose/sorbose family transporter subunit IID [Elusimicrobia bacterium]|nr:PTS system mannose/fructose/sorbose family transporter subunit IID [Elusimicrobiota bacterium]
MTARMRWRLFVRSFFIQALWSFENMQGLGFGFCMGPWLRERCGASPPETRRALARHCEYFNTQPYMAGLAIGMACALEERVSASAAEDRPALERKLRSLKSCAAGALAAIGDSFFWGAWRPFCTVLALAIGMTTVTCGAPPWTVAVAAAGGYVLVFNTPVLILRWRGVGLGYRWQDRFAAELGRFPWQKSVKAARLAGTGLAAGCALVGLFTIMTGAPGRGAAAAAALAAGWAARAYGLTSRRLYAAVWLIGTAAAVVGFRW